MDELVAKSFNRGCMHLGRKEEETNCLILSSGSFPELPDPLCKGSLKFANFVKPWFGSTEITQNQPFHGDTPESFLGNMKIN